MSINDPILLAHSPKWGYYLVRGRETFYDEERYMRTWDTAEEAVAWSEKELGVSPLEIPDEAEREEVLQKSWKKRQMKLL